MTDKPPWRCETCRHWDRNRSWGIRQQSVCNALTREDCAAGMLSSSGCEYDVYTREDFGCVLWEEMK